MAKKKSLYSNGLLTIVFMVVRCENDDNVKRKKEMRKTRNRSTCSLGGLPSKRVTLGLSEWKVNYFFGSTCSKNKNTKK